MGRMRALLMIKLKRHYTQNEIDHLAIMWNKTRDERYKEEWYKAVKLKSLVAAGNKTSRDNSIYSPLQVPTGRSF